jgi:undecaprenyl-diphosphatase
VSVRRRAIVYGVAGALIAIALVLAAAGVGEQAGRLSDWQAFTLGIVQGLTELLPISSSGHLILVPWLGQWHYLEEHPDFNKTFDVALHLGTLVAVVAYFWDDVVRFTVAWFRSIGKRAITTADEKIAWLVFVATIPAAIAGAVGEEAIEKHLGQPWQIAINLAVFGVLLWIADRSAQTRKLEDIGLLTAVGVGAAQAIALIPGFSRSGASMGGGLLVGFSNEDAARFAFLLATPIIGAAALLKIPELLGPDGDGVRGQALVASLCSAATAYFSIRFLMRYFETNRLTPFAVFCFVEGIVLSVWFAVG